MENDSMNIISTAERDHITEICKNYKIKNYNVNDDGTIDVDGNVNLYNTQNPLTELPLAFNKVSGNFVCDNHHLSSLSGSPKEVGGDFRVNYNQLTSLDGGPELVYGFYNCIGNKLTSLEHCPIYFGKYKLLDFRGNQVTAQSIIALESSKFYPVIESYIENHSKFHQETWFEVYLKISKSEYDSIKRQYTINNIVNT